MNYKGEKVPLQRKQSADCTLLNTRVNVPDALGRTQDHFCIFDA